MKIVKHKLNEYLAITLLGWKWVSFVGIPVKGTEGYPKKCRVRQLLSKKQLESESWQDKLSVNEGRDAIGDEPLAYTYCSSQGSDARVPRFTILVDEE